LIGLPPTPEEIAAFTSDRGPDAYPRLVERLLASPQYAERWARHWLDVVRYSDSAGFEVDHFYPSAWRYRDYVIHSFDADKPFDRFIQEQVAGDELWPGDPNARLGTALYSVGPALTESAMITDQLEYEWLSDAADTTGAAFLGLTFGCARCHDHKYDPITQKDYYGMEAIFAPSDRPYPDQIRLLRINSLNGVLSETPVPKELLHDPRCTLKTEDSTGMGLFHREQPMTVHRLRRGELSKPAEEASPAFPAVLLGNHGSSDFASVSPGQRRAALARWLTSPENPLVARVLVNRVWAWHFGEGIVRTPNDFGSQGQPPSHPELLDWLARDLIGHNWSLKRLHRQIMLSETYQATSVADALGQEIDPENRMLRHFPRQRLQGEAVRDAMLACAGNLNLKRFGPPIVPPLGKEELTGLFDAHKKWVVTKDSSEYTRRSIYLLSRRTMVFPIFATFDAPEVMTSCPQRPRTIVPTQALALLNGPIAREQAAQFASRLRKECANDAQDMVARAWQLAFGRPARKPESEKALQFLQGKDQQAALIRLCLALFNANEFVYVD
jgi:hypothetical protein